MIIRISLDGKATSLENEFKKRYTYRRPEERAPKGRKAGGVCSYCIFRQVRNEIGKNMTLYEYKDDMFIVTAVWHSLLSIYGRGLGDPDVPM